jgi:hypothetical protein
VASWRTQRRGGGQRRVGAGRTVALASAACLHLIVPAEAEAGGEPASLRARSGGVLAGAAARRWAAAGGVWTDCIISICIDCSGGGKAVVCERKRWICSGPHCRHPHPLVLELATSY